MTIGDASRRRLATGTRAVMISANSENILNKRVNNNAFIYCMIRIYLCAVFSHIVPKSRIAHVPISTEMTITDSKTDLAKLDDSLKKMVIIYYVLL